MPADIPIQPHRNTMTPQLLRTETPARAAAAALPAYELRLASSEAELRAAQALRFEVFNLELDEGLAESWDTGLDADPFDAVCDHLIVADRRDERIVGTYRLQTGQRAGSALGYYGEREFDFAPFEPRRGQILELGRACIHQRHRNFAVLNLLWKGIAAYAQQRGARWLLGCSSIATQSEAEGLAAYRQLLPQLAPPEWRTRPHAPFACHGEAAEQAPRIPRLLTAYLALGSRICGAPAIDREFRTVDFLTCLDVESEGLIALQRRGRFTSA